MDTIERLNMAAQEGDIESLYRLLARDPNLLEQFDHLSFCETPLHIAARHGQSHFAMEIMTLKPSLAWKLNESGFSPMHLALQNDCYRVVRGFMAIDSDLIRIKGRGRITPLHYAVQTCTAELLSEFLYACPSSIEDLSIKCETAVHIAVKSHRFSAFKVLLGWLLRINKEEILNRKDEDGNTVFHIATSTNQIEVMKLLRKIVNINAKNYDGQTAMDIFQTNRAYLNIDMSEILRGAKPATELTGSRRTLASYLSQKLNLIEKRNKLLGLSNLSDSREGSHNVSDVRSSVLVVAILIATATYQAGLSPPGGFWQENSEDHSAGQMTLSPFAALFFFGFNGLAFFSSISVIMILIIGLPMWTVVYGSTAALGIANFASFFHIFPFPGDTIGYVIKLILIFEYPVVTTLIVSVPSLAFLHNEIRRRRVDFPGKYFCSSWELKW